MGAGSYHTDREHSIADQKQLYRLSKLFSKDKKAFYQVCDYLPFMLNTNDKTSLNTLYANPSFSDAIGYHQQQIVEEGLPLIRNVSHQETLDYAINTIQNFQKRNDMDSICSYFQYLKLQGEWRWVLTYKLFLDEKSYVNIGHELGSIGGLGNVLNKILDTNIIDNNGWLRFQSLSKREKEVMRMIAEGKERKEISDELFISENTVRTHRQKIMQKINAKSLKDLIHFTMAFELTDQI